MKDKYLSQLRKSIIALMLALVLTWGFVVYLMWLTNRQEQHIDALTANLYISDSKDEEFAWI